MALADRSPVVESFHPVEEVAVKGSGVDILECPAEDLILAIDWVSLPIHTW